MARKMDFEKLIKGGENPNGFTSQTCNGTGHYKGTGFNRAEPFSRPQVREGGPWQPNGNRTGE